MPVHDEKFPVSQRKVPDLPDNFRKSPAFSGKVPPLSEKVRHYFKKVPPFSISPPVASNFGPTS